MPRMARPTRLAALALLLLAFPVAAENAASGHFESKNWNVPLEDAYAFRDDSFSGEGRAILVAISNFEIGEDFLDRYVDRRYMLDKYFADAETRVAYLEFAADGRYLGYSYFFESGDGCGWCGGPCVRSRKTSGSASGRTRPCSRWTWRRRAACGETRRARWPAR